MHEEEDSTNGRKSDGGSHVYTTGRISGLSVATIRAPGRNVTQTADDVDTDLDDSPVPPVPSASAGTPEPGELRDKRLSRLGWVAMGLAALAMLAYGVNGGLHATHAILASLVVVGTQILPGMLAWRSVRPRNGWLIEDLAIGFAVGSVLAIGAQVVAGLTETPWISYSPVLVAVVLLAVPRTRARILAVRSTPLPWWWSTSIGALFLVTIPQLRGYFRWVPLSWPSGFRTPHIDAYLHLALAAQLAHRGPTTFPWVRSESLAYHWFSHAWVAQVSVASGAPLDEVLFRFMPVLMPIVVVTAIGIAAVRLSGRTWTGPVAAALALIGGDLNVFGTPPAFGTPIAPLSPSLALAIPMMVGAVLVLALRWKKEMAVGGIALLPILCIGAAGTKGSTLPLLVVGLGLALVAMLVFQRSKAWPVLIDLAIVIACLVFALVFVFQGSDAGLNINPDEAATETGANGWLGLPHSKLQIGLILLIAAGGVLARGIGAFALPFTRSGRRSPVAWTLIGGSLAGAGAVAVFGHPGASQWYFARTAEPLLAIGSCLGLVALFDRVEPRQRVRVVGLGLLAGFVLVDAGKVLLGPLQPGAWRHAVAMLLIALAVLAITGVIAWFFGAQRKERMRFAAGAMVVAILTGGLVVGWTALLGSPMAKLRPVSQNAATATSTGEIAAARWIRDHSGVNDVVMTNRHCTTPMAPVHCDSRRFVVAAFSERQVLLEGWTATPESAKLGPKGRDSITVNYWKPDLLALNDGFIADPTADAAAQLRKLGVKWIYADHTRPYASPSQFEPYATLRYQSSGVDVYEFTGSQ